MSKGLLGSTDYILSEKVCVLSSLTRLEYNIIGVYLRSYHIFVIIDSDLESQAGMGKPTRYIRWEGPH